MKGLFIPDITAEMFRTGCLESIETLMAEGEIYDIEYEPKSKPERKKGVWLDDEDNPESVKTDGYCGYCSACKEMSEYLTAYCGNCGADMRGTWNEK